MTKSLTLIIPEFDANLKQMPALKKLLARAERRSVSAITYEAFLFELFGFAKTVELPIGAVSGLADGLATRQGYWLRADPVELRADLAAVYFMGNEHLQVSVEEIRQLATEINALLNQDGLTLHTPDEKRWYLQCDFDPGIITYSPAQLWGKDVTYYFPDGSEKNQWRKWLTEIQMLLSSSAVNQKRLSESKPPINSLWFWGAGALPSKPTVQWQKIWSDDILAHGLAILDEAIHEKEPADANSCLKKMIQAGNYLAVVKSLANAEQNWFKILVSALQKRQLNNLNIYYDGCIYYINSTNIWHFWKRFKTKI